MPAAVAEWIISLLFSEVGNVLVSYVEEHMQKKCACFVNECQKRSGLAEENSLAWSA